MYLIDNCIYIVLTTDEHEDTLDISVQRWEWADDDMRVMCDAESLKCAHMDAHRSVEGLYKMNISAISMTICADVSGSLKRSQIDARRSVEGLYKMNISAISLTICADVSGSLKRSHIDARRSVEGLYKMKIS